MSFSKGKTSNVNENKVIQDLNFQGEYSINQFIVDDGFLPAEVPNGDYVMNVSFSLEDKVIFGYNLFITVSI